MWWFDEPSNSDASSYNSSAFASSAMHSPIWNITTEKDAEIIVKHMQTIQELDEILAGEKTRLIVPRVIEID